MARNVNIPITDHDTLCSDGYFVRYKLSSASEWTNLNGIQQPDPDVISTSPLVINYSITLYGLSDSSQYDIGITRQCCDGTLAVETVVVFTTGS